MYRYGDPSAGEQEFRTCLRRVLSTSAHETFLINLAVTIALPLAVVCVAPMPSKNSTAVQCSFVQNAPAKWLGRQESI
jgi:hypothetical protein